MIDIAIEVIFIKVLPNVVGAGADRCDVLGPGLHEESSLEGLLLEVHKDPLRQLLPFDFSKYLVLELYDLIVIFLSEHELKQEAIDHDELCIEGALEDVLEFAICWQPKQVVHFSKQIH